MKMIKLMKIEQTPNMPIGKSNDLGPQSCLMPGLLASLGAAIHSAQRCDGLHVEMPNDVPFKDCNVLRLETTGL
jgi:hypothetical protein